MRGGRDDSINPALAAVRPCGEVLLIGIPSEATTALDLHAAMNREVALLTLKRSNRNDHTALELIASGRIAAEKLVTHRFALKRADRAFETLAEYADGVAKAVVEL